MPSEISPQKLQEAVQAGFKRFENFRAARLMFIRNYVGQYYDKDCGPIGTEPLNLIFNAIRILLPNLVMNFPTHNLESNYVAYADYAEQLGLALDMDAKQRKLRDVYRRWIVDAIFTVGITKTGLCESDSLQEFEGEYIDTGSLFTETVDLDNFICDPNLRGPWCEAAFLGDRVRANRDALLESGLYRNDFIERLPTCYDELERSVDSLSMGSIGEKEATTLQDEVWVAELWVPQAQALVTVPASKHISFDDFLRVDDYNGPKDGPFTFLSFTPPVPGNPMPVSQVGIWNDLHIMANRMAKKIMEQADRQKDVVGYTRASADDAQEALDAGDGEAIAMDDPNNVKLMSFGGQNSKNEAVVDRLQMWFNMMANNPSQIGGFSMDAGSATEANILQGNANIGLEDAKDLVYIGVAEEARKRLFYIHTDPMMNIPIARKTPVPGPNGLEMQSQQIILTPEMRRGDWLDYTITIEPESMGRTDSNTLLKRALEFAIKVLPAAATAAQTCLAMGTPFSFPKFCTKMAKAAGITWMDEVFYDPMFQQQMAMQMMAGPQPQKGVVAPNAMMQNGQPGQVGATPSSGEEMRSEQQAGANEGQADLPVRSAY